MGEPRMPMLMSCGETLGGWRFDAAVLRVGFDRKPRRLPGIPTADEGTRPGPTSLSELLRHTGAGGFLRSSAITDEPGLTGQIEFAGTFGHVVRRHS